MGGVRIDGGIRSDLAVPQRRGVCPVVCGAPVSPFPNTIGRLLSPCPFRYMSLCYMLWFWAFCVFSWCWRGICFAAGQRQKGCYPAFPIGALTVPAIFLMLTLTCTVNYGRTPFGEAADTTCAIPRRTSWNSYAKNWRPRPMNMSLIPLSGEEGLSLASVDLKEETRAAMARLGKQYPSLAGYYPNPKRSDVLLGDVPPEADRYVFALYD